MLANIVEDENHEKLWRPPVPKDVFNFLAYGARVSEGLVKARDSAEKLKGATGTTGGGNIAQQSIVSELDKASTCLSGVITGLEGIKRFFGVDWQVRESSPGLSSVTLYTPAGQHCEIVRGNAPDAFGMLESTWPAVERYILSRTANPGVLYKPL